MVPLLWLAAAAQAAVSLSVSPSSVSNTWPGEVALTISGLNNGETVTLEKFLDLNGNNTVQAGEPLVQRLSLADGVTETIGGVRNANVPGDDDGVINKKIVTRLLFPGGGLAQQTVGKFRFRVSSPSSRFAPVEQPFAVTPTSYGQSITGAVFAGNSPLTNGLVALADPIFDNDLVAMTVAGSAGQFALSAPPGQYRVVAFKPGSQAVGSLGRAPIIALESGQTVSLFITNPPASRTVSGSLREESSDSPLPGVQLRLTSSTGDAVLAFTDASGNFNVPVTACAAWSLVPDSVSLSLLGCVGFTDPETLDTSVADATADLLSPKATGLLYGTLIDPGATPIRGARIQAIDNDRFLYAASGVTASNGAYCLGLVAGNNWYVEPAPCPLARLGYLSPPAVVGLMDGEALPLDLTARAVNARLQGRVVRNDGLPLASCLLVAYNYEGFTARTLTDANGGFDLGVLGGEWNLDLAWAELAKLALVPPRLPPLSLADDTTLSGITSIVRQVTGRIVGAVADTNGTGVSGIVASALTSADGFDYSLSGATDEQGAYDIPLFDGVWQVSLGDVSFLGYLASPPQDATVAGASQVVDFVLLPMGPLGILTTTLPRAQVGAPYAVQLEASGGASPYLWTLTSGTLPDGLSLDMDGAVTGTPSQHGTYPITVQVTDNLGTTTSQTFLLVACVPAILKPVRVPDSPELLLELSGEPYQSYVIETTTSLIQPAWTPVATNNAAAGVIRFTAPAATNAFGFYRARQL